MSPRLDHICTGHRCCCCPLASSRCAWCLPPVVRGGTAAQRPPPGGRCRGSPPEKSGSETSLWKTDGWSYLPRRHSSDKKWREKFCFKLFHDSETAAKSLLVVQVTHRWRPRVGIVWRWGTVLFGTGGGVLFVLALAPVICRTHIPSVKHYLTAWDCG